MRLDRLAQLLEQKHKFQKTAADWPPKKPTFPLEPVNFSVPEMADVNASIRNQVNNLWKIPNEQFNILRVCADAGASKPKDEHQEKAIEGFKFCRELLSIIDTLKSSLDTIDLSTVRRGLEKMLELIQKNRLHEDDKKSFPNVTALIFYVVPGNNKRSLNEREDQYGKARKGLQRMNSVIITILEEMNRLGGSVDKLPQRFNTEATKLSQLEIEKFIREYGDTYGIPDRDTWGTVIDTDPALELPLTQLVHALQRGKIPRNADKIKPIIQNIMKRRQETSQTNLSALEQEKPGPNPLTLFEDNEAQDHKLASKYNDFTLSLLLKKGKL